MDVFGLRERVVDAYARYVKSFLADLKPEGENFILVQDCTFDSPSTAAGITLGRNTNGRAE